MISGRRAPGRLGSYYPSLSAHQVGIGYYERMEEPPARGAMRGLGEDTSGAAAADVNEQPLPKIVAAPERPEGAVHVAAEGKASTNLLVAVAAFAAASWGGCWLARRYL